VSRAGQLARCRSFRELHESGCFVIPNPWDLGSATSLVKMGFRALATTSAGFAWSLGYRDHDVRLGEKLAHVLLTGRSEGYLVGRPDLAETIRRLTAYAEAGADCLYAPGLRATPDIKAVVDALAPKPVNVLVGNDTLTVEQLAAMGVRRISVGGGLARVAWTAFLQAAREIADHGTFAGLGRAAPFPDINGSFGPR
jgi:2-methylisocitrate lyase-like PEP mutase family enzyme